MVLAGGSLIFAAFLVVFTLAVIYTLYSRRGSGIAQHPYGNVYTDAPAAAGASRLSGRHGGELRVWTRGTR